LPDFEDAGQVIGTFFAGGLGMPDRAYYVSDEERMRQARTRYVQHVESMLILLGQSRRAARRGAKTILALETRLAAATLTRLERRDLSRLNHPMAPAELGELAPGMDWMAYLRARGQARQQRINVTEPAFVQAVGRLVGDTPLSELKTYLRWSALRRYAPLLARDFRDESFAFNEHYLLGATGQAPRWKTCVAGVNEDLGDALGQLFVARTFPEAIRQQVLAMVGQIVTTMRERLERLEWMEEATREQAIAKLDAMRFKVGHPERWIDYNGLDIHRDDHFGNRLRAAAFEESRQLARIGQPVDRRDWILSAQDVESFYDPQLNEMNLPAGILQPPLFDARIDAAPGWGNTGMTIGHELIHGFDDSGRGFDAAGNLRDWWQPGDAEEFEQRAQCLVEQFDGYQAIDDVPVNGQLTLGENIADLGGTILAYAGWKAATEGLQLESSEGLTPEQRFFVGFAQWACANETDERARTRAATSIYAPRRHRVNGVVVNMPEFARAFQCKSSQAMVKGPDEVCRIW
jgi:endothelin-converting enzyme/putative endopeptidase